MRQDDIAWQLPILDLRGQTLDYPTGDSPQRVKCEACAQTTLTYFNAQRQKFEMPGWTLAAGKWYCPDHKPPEA